jgi:hypothetical protein
MGEGAAVAGLAPGGFAAVIIVSLMTQPEASARLHRFFALLHTPVGEEKNLESAGVKDMLEQRP